jgi:hypothetical protein
MKKTTRKSFSRKAIVAVMSVFLTVSLTAVGFASWLISNNDSKEGTGNVNASDVSDAILGVTINDSDNLGKINFGPAKNDETGTIRYNKAEADDFEALEITVSGSIKKFATLKQMEIKIKVPDSVITAAGYKATVGEGVKTYTEDPALPKYITLPAGAADEKGNLIDTANKVEYSATDTTVFTPGTDDTATFSFKVTFGWGELFGNKNPGRYLDGEDGLTVSPENKTALLAIANAENTTAHYTELTAEAKRDILTAMKKTIAASETKFTVVVNAQAK